MEPVHDNSYFGVPNKEHGSKFDTVESTDPDTTTTFKNIYFIEGKHKDGKKKTYQVSREGEKKQ
ncbi:MAG TPA: hypothetical protein VEB86_00100 [Chryseosolibacter sp.]|nr:hypothetical protein [Chryseosolibacter sp.]